MSESPTDRPRWFARHPVITVGAFVVVLSLVMLESGLRLFTPFPVHGDKNRRPHERLVHVLSSSLPDVDAAGFRNPRVLARADIVALGDSHTYGENAASSESWPMQLGRAVGSTVYNYGVGGYGVLQYHDLFGQALSKHPRNIILGLYLANDLEDVCTVLMHSREWRAGLSADHAALLQDCQPAARSAWTTARAGQWLAEHFTLYSLVRYVGERHSVLASGDMAFDDRERKTLFGAERVTAHAAATDLTRPVIADAFRLTQTLLADMGQRARAQGITFGVLMIPSKEYVYDEAFRIGQRAEFIARAAANERALRDQTIAYLQRETIAVVDVAPPLVQALRDGQRLYPPTTDGHPLPSAYTIYATAARGLLRRERSN